MQAPRGVLKAVIPPPPVLVHRGGGLARREGYNRGRGRGDLSTNLGDCAWGGGGRERGKHAPPPPWAHHGCMKHVHRGVTRQEGYNRGRGGHTCTEASGQMNVTMLDAIPLLGGGRCIRMQNTLWDLMWEIHFWSE